MVYQWKMPGLYNLNAQIVGEELERISHKGELTPSNIVDESRNEEAILHNLFEWEDKKAAQSYREYQARQIICHIVTTKVEEKEMKEPVRAFVKIQNEYKALDVVVKIPDYKNEMLKNALKELKNFQSKYAELKELTNILDDIQITLEDLKEYT